MCRGFAPVGLRAGSSVRVSRPTGVPEIVEELRTTILPEVITAVGAFTPDESPSTT